MANTREVEIVDSLRSQGYTSNQIIGAVRQHRHNIKVAAEQARVDAINKQRREDWLKEKKTSELEIQEEQEKFIETISIDKKTDATVIEGEIINWDNYTYENPEEGGVG